MIPPTATARSLFENATEATLKLLPKRKNLKSKCNKSIKILLELRQRGVV
jgi:hypothetical protein